MAVNSRDRIKRIALLQGISNSFCDEAAGQLDHDLRAAGFTVVRRREEYDSRIDLVILLGGDGFLMESVRTLDYPSTPFLGVSFGSVGFLMNPRHCVKELLPSLKAYRFRTEQHPVLEATVHMEHGGRETRRALNDIVLERAGGQAVRLRLLVDGVLLNEFSGDGVIVSTSAGSTAYNLAAGGPAFHPRIPAVAVTPLYPHRAAPFHSLQFPVLLPLDSRLELGGLELEKRPVRLLADGRTLEGLTSVEVFDSGLRVNILRMESHEFVSALARKFIRPET